MFKKISIALIAALALPVIAFAQKFGTVDPQGIIFDLPEYKAAQTQFAEASKKYEDEYKKLTDEVDKKMQEYQALEKDPATPAGIKERRQQELQEFYQKAQSFQQTASQDLQRQQQQLMAPIEQKVYDAIKAVGQENGFTVILPAGVAAFTGSDVIDTTPMVRKKLGLSEVSSTPAAAPTK